MMHIWGCCARPTRETPFESRVKPLSLFSVAKGVALLALSIFAIQGAEATTMEVCPLSQDAALPLDEGRHYTFVLTPESRERDKYIEASRLFTDGHEDFYSLRSDGSSMPHITIAQFDCDSPLVAWDAWKLMRSTVSEMGLKPFRPPFSGLAFVDGDGPYLGTTWVELSVKRGAVDSPVMRVHGAAEETLDQLELPMLNARGNNYRPHLTLTRIKLGQFLPVWKRNLTTEAPPFHLEFGISSQRWEYIESLDRLY